MNLDQLPGAGFVMQAIDVLGDHRIEQAGALEPHQRAMGCVGLPVLERLEAIAVEMPEALRISAEDVDVRHFHRVDVRPQPGAGGPEVGIPDGTEMPAPVNATTLRAPSIIAASRSVSV